MKNKTKTYVLLASVLAIWGTITYKIINGLNPDTPEITATEFNQTFNPKPPTSIDTFTIKDIDRDPFLGTLSKKETKKLSNSKIQSYSNGIKNFPIVVFNGVVKKQNAKEQIFVLSINNKQQLMKRGQVIDSVTLVKGNKSEIVIRYHQKLQTIKRE